MSIITFVLSISLMAMSVAGFSNVILQQRIVITRRPSHLYSIIFEPPSDENCELDGSDCEESVFDRKRREKADAHAATIGRYQQQGIMLTEMDLMESVDQYQNAPTGGNLIPGVHLSSLCEDD